MRFQGVHPCKCSAQDKHRLKAVIWETRQAHLLGHGCQLPFLPFVCLVKSIKTLGAEVTTSDLDPFVQSAD